MHKNRGHGRKRKQALLAAAVAFPLFFAPQSAMADGPECGPGGAHCYGVVHYNESQPFSAAGEDLWTDCLHLDTPLSDFAVHDFWIQWDDGRWIETGYDRGVHAGHSNSEFRWFWGEYTGTTFYSHKVANAPVSTWINFSWYRQTSVANAGKWALFIDGTYRAMTSATYDTATETDTGGETIEPQVYSNGNSKQMKVRRASDSVWYTPLIDNVTETAGVYDAWHNGSSAMEQQSLQNDCAEPLAAKANEAKPPTEGDLLTFAQAMAKVNGGKSEAVELAETKRRNALKANAEAADNPDVHVLQVKGNFTGNMISKPHGFKTPTGTVLTYVLDKATGEVTDWSLGNEAQDLKKFGSVKKLG